MTAALNKRFIPIVSLAVFCDRKALWECDDGKAFGLSRGNSRRLALATLSCVNYAGDEDMP